MTIRFREFSAIKEKYMKFTGIRLMALLLALLCCSACSKLPKMEYDAKSGSYTNQKTGIVYVHAESYYEAAAVLAERTVARIADMGDLTLYEMQGIDPTQMIASADLDIFYAEGLKMPTLAEMNVDKVYVGQVAEGATLDNVVAEIEAVADIDALVTLYQNGTAFSEKDMLDDQLSCSRYNLRFASSQYPAFYYCLTYRQYSEDVLVYERIDSQEGFVPTYTGEHITVSFETDGDELCAVYNFGKHILYDRVLRECYAVGELFVPYLT